MKINTQFVVVCGLQVLSRVSGDWTKGEEGIDHMYADLNSFPMKTNDTIECYNACADAQTCNGWVVCPANLAGCENSCSPNQASTCWLKSDMLNRTTNPCRISGYVSRIMLPPAFETTPVGSVTPTGWLKAELSVMAEGLTGYLAYFWQDISNSSWIGGSADGGLHERTPYWLNGLVPLSYLVQTNANLTAQRDFYLQFIMSHQLPSGWIGIDDMPTDGNQYWGRFNVLLSLIQYYEASNDPAAMTCIFNYLGEANRRMSGSVQLGGWAAVRAQDFIMAIWWLTDNFDTLKGVPSGYSQPFLIDLADLTHQQMLDNDADWKTWFDTNAFPTTAACDGSGTPCNMLTHGVNIGQALKSEAVWYRRSQDLTDIDSTYIRTQKLDKYHGIPSGMYQADEHLAGYMPSHGTETCAVVESVVSYAVSGAIIGDAFFFDRAERITYNALPAATTKDQWERVYLQQSNEIKAVEEADHVFYTDGADSAIFDLEGNYGCCTANMHAGWPKFAQRAVGFTPANGGVAVLMWAPLTAVTPNATVSIVTDYPFGDVASVTVTPVSGTVPVLLRIPGWATGCTLAINGGAAQTLTGANGTFYATAAAGVTTFTLAFNPTIRLETYFNGAVAVVRGALVYSAWIGQNISVTTQNAFNSQDLAVTATQPWNLALVITDRSNPGADLTFAQLSGPTSVPFNSTAIPVAITGMARLVNGWSMVQNAADGPPSSPACAVEGACGAPIPVLLVPFGSTHIRMAVLPTA